jgi:hypothetical protein
MTYPYNAIPSNNPQNFSLPAPIGLQSANRDPTAQDNTFPPGSEWQNTVTGHFFKCISSTISGAVWDPFITSGTGTVATLTGNSGGMVPPNGSGNINVVGDGTTVNIVGSPGTNTLTASLVGGKVAAQSFVTNVSGPVVPTAAGVVDLNASTSTYTDGTTANTIKTEVQGTNHAVFVGRGASTPATTLSVGATGTVLIGTTGADPSFSATPTVTSLTLGSGNALSTYVQGTFTPALAFGGSSTGITYSIQAGEYTQIGNVVHYVISLLLTSKGAQTGAATITGLPVTTGGQGGGATPVAWANVSNVTLTAGYTAAYFGPNGTTSGSLYQQGSAEPGTTLADTNFANNSFVYTTGLYFTS